MKKNHINLAKHLSLTLLLSSSISMAASGTDETYKNITLEERLYLFDGYGSNWGLDAGNDGLWFVPERPIGDTYSAPFKVRNSASSNTFVIGSNTSGMEGYVGVGTDAPQAKLDVQGDAIINGELNTTQALSIAIDVDNSFQIQRAFAMSANNTNLAKKSDVGFVLENSREAFSWQVRTWEPNSSFSISKENSGGKELIITGMDEVGGMVLTLGNGATNSGGNWINASSRELKENIEALSTDEALEAFHALKPVSYNYKTDKSEQVLGFIAEDVPDIVAINSRKGISSMDMVALLTKVVQVQEEDLKAKDVQMEEMKNRLNEIENLLTNITISNQ